METTTNEREGRYFKDSRRLDTFLNLKLCFSCASFPILPQPIIIELGYAFIPIYNKNMIPKYQHPARIQAPTNNCRRIEKRRKTSKPFVIVRSVGHLSVFRDRTPEMGLNNLRTKEYVALNESYIKS